MDTRKSARSPSEVTAEWLLVPDSLAFDADCGGRGFADQLQGP